MPDQEGARRPRSLAAAMVVAALWAAASSVALAAGVRQISDDDYARTVIAQSFAHAPRLDPSGTSWLPLPFWLLGAAMAVFGASLQTARTFAIVSAAASGAILFAGGRAAGLRPQGAAFASILPLAIPLVPILGACPVPEIFTAALVAYAALISPDARGPSRWLAAAALTAACLSRYEAWPAAVAFAVWSIARVRSRGPSTLGVAAVAVAGIAGWLAWNAHAHGDPLRFAGRVSAYRAALSPDASPLSGYLLATVRGAPVHVAAVGLAVALTGPFVRHRLRFVGLAAAVSLIALTLAAQRGGAPTHHPERAVVALWLLGSVALSAALPEALRRLHSQRTRASVLLGGALAVVLHGISRAPATLRDLGADRRVEIAVGTAMATAVPATEKVLLVPSSYGYFATLAAFGRPEDARVVSLRRLDPRATREDDPFASPEELRRSMADEGASWVLADDDAQLQVARAAADREIAVASRSLLHVR